MATHTSVPPWEIPWREEPGALSPWGLRESDVTERLTLVLSIRSREVHAFQLGYHPSQGS